jgi:hypothetical protein
MPTISIFDFIHTAYDSYPNSSVKVQFGNGYQFAATASGVDQIITTLKFNAMKYYLNAEGVPDATIFPDRNMLALQNFYEAHRLSKPFVYLHQTRGLIFVRFESPLQCPKVREGGQGVTESFEMKVIYQP